MSNQGAAGTSPAELKSRSTIPRSFSEAVLPPNMAKTHAANNNMGVEYVLIFRFSATEKEESAKTFEQLVHKLARVGLATEVRQGEDHTLMVFIKIASLEHVYAEVYRSRVRDWIHGVRLTEPAQDVEASLNEDPLTDAERLLIIYQLITNDEKDGGAGIRPKTKRWPQVESIFALHDHVYNKHWLQKWSTNWQLNIEDLDEIRNKFGEKVAYYFAFEQTYFNFLIYPGVGGFLAWLLLDSFSPIFAVLACSWCVIFVEWWKHRERDLALRWGVRGVSNIESKRDEFEASHEIEDVATGEKQKTFPAWQRLQRQALQLPFAICAIAVLGSLIILCFVIEIFIGEVYDGPGKSVLTYLPVIILTTCMPFLTNAMTGLATRLNDYENYETASRYESALTAKLFVMNFITSYLGLILTAFVYVPFGKLLIPHLDVANVVARSYTDGKVPLEKSLDSYDINPDRLRKQVIYFAVTASIVNFATEVVVPYFKRQGTVKFRELTASRKRSGSKTEPSASANDVPEEREFLARVRSEAELTTYDVQSDLREMIIQFGYLSLFSVVWPLVPVSFLVNNWFELRADAFKICLEMQRPTPARADSIGPWLDALEFLTWLGSLTMGALTYMFSNDGVGPDGSPYTIKGWGLLLSIFLSEQIYLVSYKVVRYAISKIDSPGRQKERRARYLVREQFLSQSLGKLARAPTFSEVDDEKDVTITRESLEEEQRQSTLSTSTPEKKFWSRQQGWRETAKVGQAYITQSQPNEKESAQQKKEL